jgi:hypothetical protein
MFLMHRNSPHINHLKKRINLFSGQKLTCQYMEKLTMSLAEFRQISIYKTK